MNIGKLFIGLGLLLLLIGGGLILINKLGLSYRNPLDFAFKNGRFQFYFPLGTSLLISLLVTFLLYLFRK
ncbi:MAG: DUF2905 domain-containing protein [Bacteroidetes bacterium]|nr:DUF2905 domain-containing protein [Bacteroidota bacterium]MDA0937302.1 DUF2905 domain-containing protein [Bacteroidota bacterium]MDA1344830.1 DUF2905 domain-containing protein [Bacteroidota bacterium]